MAHIKMNLQLATRNITKKLQKLNIRTKRASVGFIILVVLMYTLTLYSNNLYISQRIYYALYPEYSISCFRAERDSLTDISDVKVKKDKTIFFHETSCKSYQLGKIVITPRQACAVESAAKLNPNFDVILTFTSPGVMKFQNTESDRMLKALLSYSNVKILHLNYERYTQKTPLEDIYKSRRVDFSYYAQSHASDVLRYLTLSKFGGIYLDLDVIVVKSLENLPPNFAGSESDKNVAAGVLSFEATGIGHHHAKQCVDDLQKNFKGDEWGYNGPGVVTRLLKKICGVQDAKDMLQKYCQGFTVYAPEYFYPVPWWNWTIYFDTKYSEAIKSLTKNSYVIHVWNKHSSNKKINVGCKVPYALYAEKYCPKVYKECDNLF